MPHEDLDLLLPRVPAYIERLTSYKNNRIGAHFRGGDAVFTDCRMSDNGHGMIFVSDATWPYDEGSHQEATGCVVVGESDNRGTDSPGNSFYGLGADGEFRTLPGNASVPLRGVAFWQGPVSYTNSSFYNLVPTQERNTSVISFQPKTPAQNTPKNTISDLTIDQQSLPIHMGEVGITFGSYDSDSDKTQIFHDEDGSATGYTDSYSVRPDNWLMRTDQCTEVPEFNAAICSGVSYGVLHITATGKSNNLTTTRLGYENVPVTLKGATLITDPTMFQNDTTFNLVLLLNEVYTSEWSDTPPPLNVTILLSNFQMDEYVMLDFHYPSGTSFSLWYDEWQQMEDIVAHQEHMLPGSSPQDVVDDPDGLTYFWEDQAGMLHLKLIQRNLRDPSDTWNICAPAGCQRIHISATYP